VKIAAIRETGADNLVFVPGNGWTGASGWTDDLYGTPNADVMGGAVDAADNFVFEAHQYLDSDSSGAADECVSESVGAERLKAFTNWLRDNGFRGFLGEFGSYATPTCFRALDNMLAYMGDNADLWLGWSWWAAGPWWGDYPLSIEPNGGTGDKPQMVLLSRHLTTP
jgi:endoglucanase